MNYSKAHQNFSNYSQKPGALTVPQDFLGPNYETVLNFWTFNDSLTEDNWNEVARRYRALDPAAGAAAGYAAWDAALIHRAEHHQAVLAAVLAAGDAARAAAGYAARYAAGYAARSAARYAARDATYELMGMHTILNDGKTLLFVPLFNGLDNS
jgi:hypothetical protein